MSLDKIIVIISGLVGIGFVYWFFLARYGGPIPEDHSRHDSMDHHDHHK